MQMRTPGRRNWEVRHSLRAGSIVAFLLLVSSVWFLYDRVKLLEKPHNPHYEISHCYDCHEQRGSKMTGEDCFKCHDPLTRELLAGALEKRKEISPLQECRHPLKIINPIEHRSVTSLCKSCHKNSEGVVAMTNISTKLYVEIDMSVTHPIGLQPTDSIRPDTLPLDKVTGAINCVTCHDPHGLDKRYRMLRYYYPGNGRPADFRPLCLDCHENGWLPLKFFPEAVRVKK